VFLASLGDFLPSSGSSTLTLLRSKKEFVKGDRIAQGVFGFSSSDPGDDVAANMGRAKARE